MIDSPLHFILAKVEAALHAVNCFGRNFFSGATSPEAVALHNAAVTSILHLLRDAVTPVEEITAKALAVAVTPHFGAVGGEWVYNAVTALETPVVDEAGALLEPVLEIPVPHVVEAVPAEPVLPVEVPVEEVSMVAPVMEVPSVD